MSTDISEFSLEELGVILGVQLALWCPELNPIQVKRLVLETQLEVQAARRLPERTKLQRLGRWLTERRS